MDDRRPEFQRMVDAALRGGRRSFDRVVLHSFSRFFRDHFELEFYVRKLAKNGVKLVSITQELGDDPMRVMMRQIMTLTASTGASLAACALAGLAALSGPLHGGMASQVQAFAEEARAMGPQAAVAARLAMGAGSPGFGHPLYPEGDPRARALLSAFQPDLDLAHLATAVREMTGERPNIDFALTALVVRLSLPLASVDFVTPVVVPHIGASGEALKSWLYLPGPTDAGHPPPLVIMGYPGAVYSGPPGSGLPGG